MQITSEKAEERAEACAILSSLDPESKHVQQAFLHREFCQELFFPLLLYPSLPVALEAANTIK